MVELSPREAAFVREYVLNGRNGTKAVMAAGYSAKGADVQAVRLLKRAHVQAALKRAEADAARRSGHVRDLLGHASGPPPEALVSEIARETDADRVASLTRAWILALLMENYEIAVGRKKAKLTGRKGQDFEAYAPNRTAANQAAVILLAAAGEGTIPSSTEDSNKELVERMAAFKPPGMVA